MNGTLRPTTITVLNLAEISFNPKRDQLGWVLSNNINVLESQIILTMIFKLKRNGGGC